MRGHPSRRRWAWPPSGLLRYAPLRLQAAMPSEILAPGTELTYNNNQPKGDHSELTKNQLPLAPLSAPPQLARMQVKERAFEFIRNGNRVTEVREGGRPLATLRENRLTGAVELVKRGGEVITFELGKRPLVQVLAGSPTPVIGGLIPTISKIILPDGKETRFDFATNEKLLPTVAISGGEPNQTTRP